MKESALQMPRFTQTGGWNVSFVGLWRRDEERELDGNVSWWGGGVLAYVRR